MKNMAKFMAVVCVMMVSAAVGHATRTPVDVGEGCAGTPAAQIVAPSEKLGECIAQAALSDLVEAIADPASLIPAIGAACASFGVADAATIWKVVESYLTHSPLPDSGVALSPVQITRLLRVHAAAKALDPDSGT